MASIEQAISSGIMHVARAEVIHANAMRIAGVPVRGVEFDVQTRSEVVDNPHGVIVVVKQTHMKEDVATIAVGIAVRVHIVSRDEIEASLGEDWRQHIRGFVVSLYDKLCRDTASKVMDIVEVTEEKPQVKMGLRAVKDDE